MYANTVLPTEAWLDLGNGDSTNLPTSLWTSVLYTYNDPGYYDVTLHYQYGLFEDSIYKPSLVKASTMQPGFTGEPRSGFSPLVVQFTDQTEGLASSWQWAFGDGSSSDAQNPTHIFYYDSLQANKNRGDFSTSYQYEIMNGGSVPQSSHPSPNRLPFFTKLVRSDLEGKATSILRSSSSFEEVCSLYSYYSEPVAYYWRIPDAYGDDYFNMRFTAEGDLKQLQAINILFYNNYQEFNCSDDGVTIFLWTSSGGFPDQVIDSFCVPCDSLVFHPDWFTLDISDHDIIVGGDFHIGYTVNDQITDNVAILSDDGDSTDPWNAQRSSERWEGNWNTMLYDWGVDVRFMIEAVICPWAETQSFDVTLVTSDGMFTDTLTRPYFILAVECTLSVPELDSPLSGSEVSGNPIFEWSGICDGNQNNVVVAEDTALTNTIWSKNTFETSQEYDGTVLTPGATYFWSVRTRIAEEWSEFAPSFSFIKAPPEDTLPGPTIVFPLDGDSISLPETFVWSVIDSADYYHVQISPAASFDSLVIDNQTAQGAENNSMLISNLAAFIDDSTYYWRVQAIDKAGYPGYYSNIVSFVKVDILPLPEAIEPIYPPDEDTTYGIYLTFEWHPEVNSSCYDLQYSLDSTVVDTAQVVTISCISDTTRQVVTPPGTGKIFWRVRGCNATACGDWGGATGGGGYSWTNYSNEPTACVTFADITYPTSGTTVDTGTTIFATAFLGGDCDTSEVVTGKWYVNAELFDSFSTTMTYTGGRTVQSSDLPTADSGWYTVSVLVTSPDSVYSDTISYHIVEPEFSYPHRLDIVGGPVTFTEFDGIDGEFDVQVLDEENNLVASDSGRIIMLTLIGAGFLDFDSLTTDNGFVSFIYQHPDNPDTSLIVANSDDLLPDTIIVITHENALVSILDLSDGYLQRLEEPGLDHLPGTPAIDTSYVTTDVRWWIENEVDIPSPDVADTISLRRLNMSLRLLNAHYYHPLGQLFAQDPDQTRVCGSMILWDDAVCGTVDWSSPVLYVTNAGYNLLPSLPVARRTLISEMLSDINSTLTTNLTTVSSGYRGNVTGVYQGDMNQIIYNVKSLIEGGGTVSDAVGDLGIRTSGDDSCMSSFVINSQYLVDSLYYLSSMNLYGGDSDSALLLTDNAFESIKGLSAVSHQGFAGYWLFDRSTAYGISLQYLPPTPLETAFFMISSAHDILNDSTYSYGMTESFAGLDNLDARISSDVTAPFMNFDKVFLSPTHPHSGRWSNLIISEPNQEFYQKTIQKVSDYHEDFITLLSLLYEYVDQDNTAEVDSLIDPLYEVCDSLHDQLRVNYNIILSALQQGMVTIPDFEDQLNQADWLVRQVKKSMDEMILSAMLYVFVPDETNKQDLLARREACIGNTNQARDFLTEMTSSIFTLPSSPVLSVSVVSRPDTTITEGINFEITVSVSNDGSGIGFDCYLKVVSDPGFELISEDSVFLGDLSSGNSVETMVTLRGRGPEGNPSAEYGWGMVTFLPNAEGSIQVPNTYSQQFQLVTWICGDADGNDIVEVSDAVYLINYVFIPDSPAPDPYESGDADCTGVVEISDAVYIINYVFVPDSPAPCDPDGDGEPDC